MCVIRTRSGSRGAGEGSSLSRGGQQPRPSLIGSRGQSPPPLAAAGTTVDPSTAAAAKTSFQPSQDVLEKRKRVLKSMATDKQSVKEAKGEINQPTLIMLLPAKCPPLTCHHSLSLQFGYCCSCCLFFLSVSWFTSKPKINESTRGEGI